MNLLITKKRTHCSEHQLTNIFNMVQNKWSHIEKLSNSNVIVDKKEFLKSINLSVYARKL